ncbi:MAG: LTA synthase family protein [Lachnospiraceae bacterium]|nr:LTA synthase family protein [Lachnospiraceae bacterium]
MIVTALPEKIEKWASRIVTAGACLVFVVQLVFHSIFKIFLSVYSIGENGSDVLEFWKEALNAILKNSLGIILLFLPLFLLLVLQKKGFRMVHFSWPGIGIVAASCAGIHVLTLALLLIPGKDMYSPYDLYNNGFVQELGVQKLGMLTAVKEDIRQVFFGGDSLSLDDSVFLAMTDEDAKMGDGTDENGEEAGEQGLDKETGQNADENSDGNGGKEQSGEAGREGMQGNSASEVTATPSLTPTPVPVDTSPNVLNLDFEKMGKEEDNETIRKMHEYFGKVQPTKKNEYTGMFEGYNLIVITAEGFSPWAVDEEVTPTLYKLTHEGFVFENFYTPIWWTSTSDGEYVSLMSLIPGGSNSFSKSSHNALPFSLAHQFLRLGYTARAYHDHSYTYYNRDESHPNMGYDYKGAGGGGLTLKETWPESDVEMMDVTVPEYVTDEKFHVYYMTVSGHLEYTFGGNYMASKNKEYVKDLPYSDHVKAYIACQKEFDLAMKDLIDQLNEAGVADKTVIAVSADHYPYGLTNEEISEVAGHPIEENFELYKNHFILWNAAMKEPIYVEKYCSSLDIMPTLCNLFGIDYDSRVFMGQDIFSDASPLVMFANQSFITDLASYNSKTGEVVNFTDRELPEGYIKRINSVVRNKFNISGNILKYDYYSYLVPYLEN